MGAAAAYRAAARARHLGRAMPNIGCPICTNRQHPLQHALNPFFRSDTRTRVISGAGLAAGLKGLSGQVWAMPVLYVIAHNHVSGSANTGFCRLAGKLEG